MYKVPDIGILLLRNFFVQMMCQYSSVISRNTLPPHIFAVSDAAFSSLCADDCTQCCVVSGESGAGKDCRVGNSVYYITMY